MNSNIQLKVLRIVHANSHKPQQYNNNQQESAQPGMCHNVNYLSKSGADPDSNEDRIAIETFEDVALTVNLARVNLVEERHQNERVENDGEVL